MKPSTSNAVSSLSSNKRPTNGPRASNPGNQEDVPARKARTKNPWRVGASSSSDQHSTAAPQAPLTPIIDDDDFKVISRLKTRTAKARTCNRSINPRSAAAVSRANIYNGPTPKNNPSSYYKQSCLPADERDPVLFEAERNKGTTLPRESFKTGMIIRAVLHEPDFQGAARASDITEADKCKTNTVHGAIYTKSRKMIVVATFKDNYIAVPLYTHNGRGLEGKSNPEEYISVQDHRVPGNFTPLSIHRPIVTEQLNDGIDFFHPKTTVHITYPVSRKYTLPVVKEGSLKRESVRVLSQLLGNYFIPFLNLKA